MRGRDTLKRLTANSPVGPLELGVPDQGDLADLVDLVHKSFDRLFRKKRLSEDKFGAFSVPWNAWRYFEDHKEIQATLQFRLGLGMQFPSLRRPISQDTTVAVVARLKQPGGRGALVAYFELCLLPADGRRPEDGNVPPKGSAPPSPYLSNLCVAEPFRNKGVGRAMLQLAEDIVVHVWGGPKLYLHIDDYLPTQRLYPSHGYTPMAAPFDDGVVHVVKQLVPEEQPGPLGGEAEAEAEAEAEEAEDAPAAVEMVREVGVSTIDFASELADEEAPPVPEPEPGSDAEAEAGSAAAEESVAAEEEVAALSFAYELAGEDASSQPDAA